MEKIDDDLGDDKFDNEKDILSTWIKLIESPESGEYSSQS